MVFVGWLARRLVGVSCALASLAGDLLRNGIGCVVVQLFDHALVVSRVRVVVVWPSCSETTSMSTPAARAIVAALCRRSCVRREALRFEWR